MNKTPLVSVLMAIYNCEDTLEEAVDCILNQTYENWELIMYDDCSSDNTYELAKKLAQYSKKIVFVGDGAELCESRIGYEAAPPLLRFQNAASVGICAFKNFSEEKLLSASALTPVYLRLPQAERELKAKKLNNK